MGYADLDQVKTILNISGTDDDARLASLDAVASQELDEALGLAAGSAFGVSDDDLSRTFYPAGNSDTLYLSPAVRSITSVVEDGQTLTSGTDYVLVDQRGPFWGALYRVNVAYGWNAVVNRAEPADVVPWGATVTITGQWADQGTAAVDPAVTEAATILVAGYFRRDRAGADGVTSGPEGFTFKPGNPWNDPRVQRLLQCYGAAA
jgi:hypothetical protein